MQRRTAKQHGSRLIIERLERRDLLAGDFVAGDSNRDYYVNEADLILAMKSGKFDSEEPAEWSEGDWSGDGKFDAFDLVALFNANQIFQGAYDPDAADPIDALSPLVAQGEADVIVSYDSATGNVNVATVDTEATMTTLHLSSESGQLRANVLTGGLFDIALPNSRFLFEPTGLEEQSLDLSGELPVGLTLEQLLADLKVDGSMIGGGGLGVVRLVVDGEVGSYEPGDANRDYYVDEADFVLASKAGKYGTDEPASWSEGDWNGDGRFNGNDHREVFVSGHYLQGAYHTDAAEPLNSLSVFANEGDPNVVVFYNPTNGNLRVVPTELGAELSTLHLESASSLFSADGPVERLFDVVTQSTRFVFDPSGVPSLEFPAAAPLELTLDQLQADLTVDGSLLTGGGLGIVRLSLESIQADGFQPGDSNRDYYFDEADLIQALTALDLDGGAATWEEGDWNNDGIFDSGDFVAAFRTGNYRQGPYDQRAGGAVNNLSPFATDGPADVSVYYDDRTGDVIAVDQSATGLTTIQLYSDSGKFVTDNLDDGGFFDVATENSRFRVDTSGLQVVVARNLLPTGLTLSELQQDLQVDGSRLHVGDLGTVRLESISSLPDGLPDDPTDPLQKPGEPLNASVSLEVADALFFYNEENGDVTIHALSEALSAIEIISQNRIFVGTESREYEMGLFDVATRGKYFALLPDGISQIELPGIAREGLSVAQLAADLSFEGALLNGGSIGVAIVLSRPGQLRDGDANADYFFDESDLLQMMKTGKYAANINAVWNDGDWTGDFRFDESDLQSIQSDPVYANGAYSERAQDVAHGRLSLVSGSHGDLLVNYNPDNGDVTVRPATSSITALHLTSSSARLNRKAANGQFDVSTESSYFVLNTQGMDEVVVRGILPAGLSPNDLINDIQIDAALAVGSGIGLASLSTVPIENNFQPGDSNRDFRVNEADLIQILKGGQFGQNVSGWEQGDFDGDGEFNQDDLTLVSESNVYESGTDPYRETNVDSQHTRQRLLRGEEDIRLVYLPMTGSIVVASNHPLNSIHIHSAGSLLSASTQPTREFDVSSSSSYFEFDPLGISIDEVLLQLQPHLSRSELVRDLTVDGSRLDGKSFGPVSLSIITTAHTEFHCSEIRASGAIVGDSNLDGIFNSSDLVLVFQTGHYEDTKDGNSSWYEGDWNCDGEFDSTDIIEAFRNGGFDFAAQPKSAANAIRQLDKMDHDNQRDFRDFGLDHPFVDIDVHDDERNRLLKKRRAVLNLDDVDTP